MKVLPDKKETYLALRNVFKGPNATARRLKNIRKLVTNAHKDEAVSKLLSKYKIQAITRVAQTLLRDGIFGLSHELNVRFPNAVEYSPSRCVDLGEVKVGTVFDKRDPTAGAVQAGDRHSATASSRKRRRRRLRQRSALGYRDTSDVLETQFWECPRAAYLEDLAPVLSGNMEENERPEDSLSCLIPHLVHAIMGKVGVNMISLESFLLNSEKSAALLGDTTFQGILAQLRVGAYEILAYLESNNPILGSKGEELDRVITTEVVGVEEEEIMHQTSVTESREVAAAPSVMHTMATATKEIEIRLKADHDE